MWEKNILIGQWLFVACCIAYLVWWCFAFRPGYSAPAVAKLLPFALTALFGIAGLSFIIMGCQNAKAAAPEASAEETSASRFTPEQRFFLAYAGVWAGNIRDEEIRNRTKSDPHALGRWRVNGALPHIDAWYEAFGITESDPMFVPKAERVTIW